MLSDEEDNLIDFLEERYGCHTVILYGSRAMGTQRPDSDWDVVGICSHQGPTWYHGAVDGVGDVNAYIHSEREADYRLSAHSALYQPLHHFFRLRFGKVLVQEKGLGDAIVGRAKTMHQQAPGTPSAALVARQRYVLFTYGMGILRNSALHEAERQLERAELLTLSFGIYFQQRGMWRMTTKNPSGLAYIEKTDPIGYALLEEAYKPTATPEAIEAWLHHVMQDY